MFAGMSGPDLNPPVLLGARVFDDSDQQRFAAESCDFNPMHVDAIAARRLLSGRQVVHGVHTLIQALDFWSAPAEPSAWSVQCNFAHPISLGDRVEFWGARNAQGHHRLSARVEGVVVTDIFLRGGIEGVASSATAAGEAELIAALAAPLNAAPESWEGRSLEVASRPDRLAAWFPRAAALLGSAGLSDLARLSFLVGMVCPGLHSVFGSLQFALGSGKAAAGPLRVEVNRYDPRFRMFFIAFQGTVRGELRAFVRPPPQKQLPAAELRERVRVGSWTGRKALVVGGSRGLGELTAKLLGAAGCDVTISHASGRDDALAVARDINAAGPGR